MKDDVLPKVDAATGETESSGRPGVGPHRLGSDRGGRGPAASLSAGLRSTGALTPPPPSTGSFKAASTSRKLRLGHVLFLSLLLSGIIPLAISSTLLIRQNRGLLVEQERRFLVNSTVSLSEVVNSQLVALRRQVGQCGDSLLSVPGPLGAGQRLQEPWIPDYLATCLENGGEIQAVRILDPLGLGREMGPSRVSPLVDREMKTAFQQARATGRLAYRFASSPAEPPMVVLAVPVGGGGGSPPQLILEAAARISLGNTSLLMEGGEGAGALLVDVDGKTLWSNAVGQRFDEDIRAARVFENASHNPESFARSFVSKEGGSEREVQMTVFRIEETGWSVAVVKPTEAALAAVDRMIYNTLLSSLVLVLLALVFAMAVSRRVGEPLSRLASNTHQIAAGNFDFRVKMSGLFFEMADLAENFNRMSATLESYVDQLKRAAATNRELFLGSIRAFAAAIDAKDPYTRGHSERVASLSRVIARAMGFEEEFQHRVWLGALLHDVGKIGVDDRILKKGELLTAEEFDQMKLHTVIGAEIMGRIEQLKEIVPAIRWHHEAWNGRGYPDSLKGEQIPLIARIVAVADTYDAVTTTRPYQQAYTPDFAVETIRKLVGARFDAKVVTAFLSAFEAGQIESAVVRPVGPTEEIRATAALLG